ncbi:MAG: nucleotidyltransferase domain-containing protein [bacterium]
MRLSDDEKRDIARAAAAVLPPGSRVCLFGSSVDDARRGGDVDLLVEMPALMSTDDIVSLRSLFTAQLYRRMGERLVPATLGWLREPHERPKAGRSRPPPVGIKQSGKATFA